MNSNEKSQIILAGFLILLLSYLTGFSQNQEAELPMGNKANLQENVDNKK